MRGFSLDLRERIVKAVEAGESKPKVAKRFGVDLSTVKRYMRRKKAGKLEASKPPGLPSRLDSKGAEVLKKQVEEHNDWTLEQHAQAFSASTGIPAKKSVIGKYFKQLKITRKKKPDTDRA